MVDLAEAGMAFPADHAGGVTVGVAALVNAGTVTVGVADSADAGRSSPADLAVVVAADVAALANAGMVTVCVADLAVAGLVTVAVTDLADAGMVFPADLTGAVTIGVAPMAVGGIAIRNSNPADPVGAVTVGVGGGGDVSWADRMLPGNGRHVWTPSLQGVDCQYVNYVGCAPMEVSGVAQLAECSGTLATCSSDQSCPAVDYMTCWEKLEAMSDDSYDSYEWVDGRPEHFDYDDPRDYEEWCA